MTDHACLVLDSPLFIGREAEGPYKGDRVLFVSGMLRTRNFIDYLGDSVDSVYFGAARLSGIPVNTVREVSYQRPRHRICAEVGSLQAADHLFDVIRGIAVRGVPHFIVFTQEMRLPDGSMYSYFSGAADAVRRYTDEGINCGLKVDNGHEVTIHHRGTCYHNVIGDQYAEDVRVPLL